MKNIIKLIGFIVLVAVMVFSMAACATNAARVTGLPLTWTEVRPFGVPDNPDDNNIFWNVAFGGGKFHATRNNDNRLVYSEDGITWTEVTPSPLSNGRGAIAYGGGTFVAGRYRDMVYSADGITWTKSGFNENAGILSLAYGDGKFVMGSDWARAYYSTDGVTWTEKVNWGTIVIRAIAYGGGRFVAVGNDINWDNGESVAPGQMSYLDDDFNWNGIEQTIFDEALVNINGLQAAIADIAYGGGKFVAVGGKGKMAYSADGIIWTEIEQSIFGEEDLVRAIAYGGGKFVAVGARGKMAYSTDGITWTAVKESPNSNRGINDIAYGNGRFVIVMGEDKIAYSNLQE